jgi:hypothetical protein
VITYVIFPMVIMANIAYAGGLKLSKTCLRNIITLPYVKSLDKISEWIQIR